MIGFFRVTDEERIAAGIHIDYEKQESPANFYLSIWLFTWLKMMIANSKYS